MKKKLFFCKCQAGWMSSESLSGIEAHLLAQHYPFVQVSDLCGCAVSRKNELQQVFGSTDEALVIACYPRAVKLLLQNAGIDPELFKTSYLNARETATGDVLAGVDAFMTCEPQTGEMIQLQGDPEWPAWYPVIDYNRCNTCGQCADFCLFGVYEKQEDKVVVVHPHGCKNNCPACGRICPQTAIVFPKYEKAGAIAGDHAIDDIAEQQRQQEDITSILGSNIYQALEMRKLKRRSIIRSTAMQKALDEREKALTEQNLNK
jgi:NAD-dependent dihydropyrimidine dehydrogenase PreA subunit